MNACKEVRSSRFRISRRASKDISFAASGGSKSSDGLELFHRI
jgi:hypothetical protein